VSAGAVASTTGPGFSPSDRVTADEREAAAQPELTTAYTSRKL
jgi:hypothetical protein